MKLSVLLSIAVAIVSANADKPWTPPNVEDAAVYARTLIHRESLANINTVYQEGDDQGLPASFVEYYADCGDGNPVILAIDMATSFKNVNKGSPATLSVRVGDHAPHEHVDPHYPGSRPDSVAGSPRINLRGKFVDVAEEELPALEQCFLKRHKDAAWWLPGNPIHSSHWVKFEVDDAYFLGGFGDTGYIGKIPSDLYKSSEPLAKPDHVNDFKHDGKPGKFHHKQNKGDFLLSQAHKYAVKINKQIELLMAALTESSDAVIPVEEHMQSVWSNTLKKRDEDGIPSEISLKDLSKEQIQSMIEELVTLKGDLVTYANNMAQKMEQFKADDKPAHPKSHHKWDLKEKLEKGEITEEEFKAAKAEIYKNKKNHGDFKSKHHKGGKEASEFHQFSEEKSAKKAHHGDVKSEYHGKHEEQSVLGKVSAWIKGEEPAHPKSHHKWELKEKLEKGEITEEEFKAAKAEIYKNKKNHGDSKDFKKSDHKSEHKWDLKEKLEKGEITEEEFKAAKAEIYKNKKAEKADSKDFKKSEHKSEHKWGLKEKLEKGEITEEEFKAAKAEIYKNKKAEKADSKDFKKSEHKSEHKWGLKEKLEKGEITEEEFKAAKAEIYKNKKTEKADKSEKTHRTHPLDKFRAKELRNKNKNKHAEVEEIDLSEEKTIFQSVMEYMFKPTEESKKPHHKVHGKSHKEHKAHKEEKKEQQLANQE